MKYIDKDTIIYLHLGFHKTATTHLQDLLEFHSYQLLSQETLFLTRFDIRPLSFQESFQKKDFKKCEQILEQAANKKFPFHKSTVKKLILSEENLAGGLKLLYSRSMLYPNLNKQIINLNKLFPNNKIIILFGIRSFIDFLPSIYGEILRHNKFFPIEDFFNRINVDNLSWFKLIDDITSHFPFLTIRTWNFEEYISNPISIIKKAFDSTLTNVDDDLFKEFQSTKIYDTESLSKSAYKIISDLNSNLQLPSVHVRQIMSRYPVSSSNSKIELYSSFLENQLLEKYKFDIEQLEKAKLLI